MTKDACNIWDLIPWEFVAAVSRFEYIYWFCSLGKVQNENVISANISLNYYKYVRTDLLSKNYEKTVVEYEEKTILYTDIDIIGFFRLF